MPRTSSQKKTRYPWLAALFNLVLPGVGYLYAGKRIVLGAGLLMIMLASAIFYWNEELPPMTSFETATTIVLLLLFAYDAYETTKEANRQK